MGRRTADDLADDPAAVGGAMSKWPRRTIAWACRDQRVNGVDEHALDALLAREVRDLAALSEKAETVGIDPSGLDARRRALGRASVERVLEATEAAYRGEHAADAGGFGEQSCPFEESGLDKACWRCPVPGNVLDRLVQSPEVEADEEVEADAD